MEAILVIELSFVEKRQRCLISRFSSIGFVPPSPYNEKCFNSFSPEKLN